jgi:iron complex outermembrane recepter protein
MKKFIQIVWFAFMPMFGFGQLSGTVTEADTKEKIPGAIVSFENSFLTAVTDAEGKFSFDKIKLQIAKVRVSRLGYETSVQEIPLPNEQIIISLSKRTYLTEEATVTATRASDNSPTAFSNITKKEIEEKNLGQDIPFLLATTPSVVMTSDAGNAVGYTGIRIRGSDATRVNVTINGIPVNDAESHQVYWVDLPDFASSIENIQIQRGIGTSTNGAGAFGGSVNIQSSAVSREAFSSLYSSYGSFNTWKNTVNFGTGLLKNKFAVEGRFSKITSDGYIDRATSDLKSFYLSGGYYGKKSTLRAILFSGKEKTYQAWYGVPEDSLKTNRTYNPAGEYYDVDGNIHYYENQTDNYQQDYYQLHYSYAANSNLNVNAALHYTKGKGYYEEYRSDDSLMHYGLSEVLINDSTSIATSSLIRQLWLDNDFYGLTFSANYTKNNLEFTFGGAANVYEGKHYDHVIWAQYFTGVSYPHVYDENDATKDDVAFFAKAIYSVTPKLHLFADMQYRTVSYSFRGFNTDLLFDQQKIDMNFFNPKGGITYDINSKNKVYASVAVGHKEPMRDDFVDSPPNSYPDAEEMLDAETGYRYSGNKIKAGINLYMMNYKDQLILAGKINDVGAYTRINVPESYRRGAELEFAWNVVKNLSLSSNVTLSENKIKEFDEYIDKYDVDFNWTGQQLVIHENTDISFSPSITSSSVLTYSFFRKFTLEAMTRYVGEQYLDNTSNEIRKLDAYLLNDFFLSFHTSSASIKDIALKLAVYNAFDTQYESNGWTYPYVYAGELFNSNAYYPQARLNWMAGISLKF